MVKEKIATNGAKVTPISRAVNQVQEQVNRSIIGHLVDALVRIQDIKTISQDDPDLPQVLRDILWRAADSVQTPVECALAHLSQEELDTWKASK